jgi:predicted TIM-barrel fold metal-dependent hydrolase
MARAPVIDADGHILEQVADAKKYLEPPWDDRATGFWQGSHPWDTEIHGSLTNREYHDGGLSPEQQLDTWQRIADRENIETAVLFPTGSGHVAYIPEPGWALAAARAMNTHLATDYGSRTSRLRPVGVLPLRDPEAAAQELRRAVTELGLVSFEVLSQGLPVGLGDAIYDPVYAEAERLGVPLCIHGTRSKLEEVGGDRFKTFAEVHTYVFPASVMLHFTSIMYNGVAERFPNLRLAFLEIGATWLPYYLDRMDEHWELRGESEMPHVSKKPTDVFREHEMYVSVEPEEVLLPQTIDHIGADHFLFASDIPHWDARFPKNLEVLESRADLAKDVKQKILYDNGKRLFGL